MITNADGIIVTSLLLTGGIAVARGAEAGHIDPVRIAIGLTGAGIGLSVLAMASPPLGAAFAGLLVMGALLKAGPAVVTKATVGLFGAAPADTSPTNRSTSTTPANAGFWKL